MTTLGGALHEPGQPCNSITLDSRESRPNIEHPQRFASWSAGSAFESAWPTIPLHLPTCKPSQPLRCL